MGILDNYSKFFLERYNNYPLGHYTTLIVSRQVQSEAIFRTEGSGEPLSKEFVHPGNDGGSPVERVVISKRKQTAVERRTGRELLREFGLLHEASKSQICVLNQNNPCEKCLDCMIYGFAVGSGGAQKSRVVTDDAFSLHPAHIVVGSKYFNALFDNSTMRNRETGEISTSFGTDEYVKPEAVFLDMETLRDLTRGEFIYVVGNILRSSRYGAISSRIGKVKNHLVGVVFSDCELYSNLELTQKVYDHLAGEQGDLDFPLHLTDVNTAIEQVTDNLNREIPGRITALSSSEVQQLIAEVNAIYQDEEALRRELMEADAMYGGK